MVHGIRALSMTEFGAEPVHVFKERTLVGQYVCKGGYH